MHRDRVYSTKHTAEFNLPCSVSIPDLQCAYSSFIGSSTVQTYEGKSQIVLTTEAKLNIAEVPDFEIDESSIGMWMFAIIHPNGYKIESGLLECNL